MELKKILVIDSDNALLAELQTALTNEKQNILVTSAAEDALELVEMQHPDLIVLCVELKNMSGYAICNKLKKNPKFLKIPLILTSSLATEETFSEHRRLKTHADGYLKKPFTLEALQKLSNSLLFPATSTVESPPPTLPESSEPKNSEPESIEIDLSEAALSPEIPSSPTPAPLTLSPPTPLSTPVTAPATTISSALEQDIQLLKQKISTLESTLTKHLTPRELEFSLQDHPQTETQDQEVARQNLSLKVVKLAEKIRVLTEEREHLQEKLQQLEQQHQDLAKALNQLQNRQGKTQKALDIAVQLIEDTGLIN